LDADGRTAVEGARVTVPEFHVETSAAKDGAFALRFQAPPGCYRLMVRSIGYTPVVRKLAVTASQTIDVGKLLLQASAFEMNGAPSAVGPEDCVPTVPVPASFAVLGYGEVVGRALWSDGRPYRSAPVSLLCPGFPSAYADADGYYRLDLHREDWGIDSLRDARSMQCTLEDRTMPTQQFPVSVPLASDPLAVRPVVRNIIRAVPPPPPPPPAGPSIVRAVCPRPGQHSVVVVGAVRDSATNLPLAAVRLEVRDLGRQPLVLRRVRITSDSSGAFALALEGPWCHLFLLDARYRLAESDVEQQGDTARLRLRAAALPLAPRP
jgi:hypothetical protein